MNDRLINRIMVAVAIVVAVWLALLIATHIFGGDQAEGQTDPPPIYQGLPFDPSLLALDRKALDEAYHQQIVKLFTVWLSQGAPEDATNLKTGLRIARRAYSQTTEQLRRLEQQLNELDEQQKQ